MQSLLTSFQRGRGKAGQRDMGLGYQQGPRKKTNLLYCLYIVIICIAVHVDHLLLLEYFQELKCVY